MSVEQNAAMLAMLVESQREVQPQTDVSSVRTAKSFYQRQIETLQEYVDNKNSQAIHDSIIKKLGSINRTIEAVALEINALGSFNGPSAAMYAAVLKGMLDQFTLPAIEVKTNKYVESSLVCYHHRKQQRSARPAPCLNRKLGCPNIHRSTADAEDVRENTLVLEADTRRRNDVGAEKLETALYRILRPIPEDVLNQINARNAALEQARKMRAEADALVAQYHRPRLRGNNRGGR
jgi:hypothetical protein